MCRCGGTDPLEGWQRQNDQSGKIHSHCGEERNDHSYRQLGTGTEYPYFFRMEEPLRSSFCAVSEYFRVAVPEGRLNIIHKYDVDPDEIELEITESILIDDFSAVTEKMQLLKEYGIRISLDDFGTGFSSLSYLKKLPINTLKIDKSFTDTLLTDSATRIITESIVSMVKSLGFESIAEGVEEEQQYKYLRAVGCDIIQGYLFGKPLSQEEIEQLLQKMY